MTDAVEMIARELVEGDVVHGQIGTPWKHAVQIVSTPRVAGSRVEFVGDTGRQRQRMTLHVDTIVDVEPSLTR